MNGPQLSDLFFVNFASLTEPSEGEFGGRHVERVDVGRAHLQGGSHAVRLAKVAREHSACIQT